MVGEGKESPEYYGQTTSASSAIPTSSPTTGKYGGYAED